MINLHYFYSILCFIGMIVFAGGMIMFAKQNMKEESKESKNGTVVMLVLAVVCFFSGRHFWNANIAVAADTKTVEANSSPISNIKNENTPHLNTPNDPSPTPQPSQSTDTGKFNSANPVPDQYLNDFLVFMDNYYNKLKDIITSGKTIDELTWSKLLASRNNQGWAMYHDITYQTDFDKEDQKNFDKRTTVATAWSFLQSLSMNYDIWLRGKYSDIKTDEKEYLDNYNKAKQLLK